MKRVRLAAVLVSLTSAAAEEPANRHWNQFRGPNGQGVLAACKVPVTFGPDSNVLWKTPTEVGASSPAIWGDRIFITAESPDRERELVTACIDRLTGDVRWTRTVQAETDGQYYSMNGPASPSPAADADHVYVYFGTYGLVCYDREGAKVWERRIDPPKSYFGPSVSPILHDDLVILVVDSNDGTSRVFALDKKTGESIWETPRPLNGHGFATPMIWNSGMRDELVVLGCRRLTSYDPADGSELWWAGGFSCETIGVPVAGDGMLLVSDAAEGGRSELQWDAMTTWTMTLEDFDVNGDGIIQRSELKDGFRIPLRLDLPKDEDGAAYPVGSGQVNGWLEYMGVDAEADLEESDWMEFMSGFSMDNKPILMAIRPGASGDVRDGFVEWELNKWTPEMPSPLFHQGRLYLLRDGGVLACVNPDDGTLIYRGRIGAMGQYVASPVVAGDMLIAASKDGLVSVVRTGDTLETLAVNDFAEQILATPALAQDRIYVRTATTLFAIGVE